MSDRNYRMLVINNSWPGWAVPRSTMARMSSIVPGFYSTISGPSDDDTNKQLEELDIMIQERVSGIILCPGKVSKVLSQKVNEARSKNIPIVTMYDDVPDSFRLTLISSDEEKQAEKFAAKVFENLELAGEKKQFKTLISYMGSKISNQTARHKGVRKAIAKAGIEIDLVDEPIVDNADEKEGEKEIYKALKTHNGKIDLIIGLNARSAIGTIRALSKIDKSPGEVKITGWDSDEDVLKAINGGWVEAVQAQNSSLMTQVAFSILESYNLGYLYSDVQRLEEMGIATLPGCINIAPFYIDKTNVNAFFRK